jgi:hypothetical protein
VEAVGERHELVAPREVPGQPHRAFDGLGARVAQEALSQRARGDLGQRLGHPAGHGVVVDVGAAVHQPVDLGLRGGHHLRVPVPRIADGDTTEAVEVFLAVAGSDPGTQGRLHLDGVEARHHAGDHVFVVELLGVHDLGAS